MKEKVGETAGAIWRYLNDQERVAITKLPKALQVKQTIAYQALGWLAREDKIDYQTEGNVTYIRLASTEVR
jgi:Mn-dependent DtxR family transcriptional regulator